MEECCVSVARETSGHTVHTPNKGNNERDTSADWDVHYIDMTNTGRTELVSSVYIARNVCRRRCVFHSIHFVDVIFYLFVIFRSISTCWT